MPYVVADGILSFDAFSSLTLAILLLFTGKGLAARIGLLRRYGIPEPRTDVAHVARAAAELDVVLVPSVALDTAGNRMGMGAGFYDRALERVRASAAPPLLVGIAHDTALVDALEPAPWDVPVDVVVTDRRVLRPDRA